MRPDLKGSYFQHCERDVERCHQRIDLGRTRGLLAGGCRAGLTPRVKILPDEVNAKVTRDTDKGRVMLVREDRIAAFVLRSSQAAGRPASTLGRGPACLGRGPASV